MADIFFTAAIQSVGWALLHFLWQGFLIAGATAAALRALPDARATTRYAIACAALLVMLAAPVSSVLADAFVGAPMVDVIAVPDEGKRASAVSAAPTATATNPGGGRQGEQGGGVERWLPVAVMIWLAGVTLLSLRVLAGWLGVRRLRSQSAERVAASVSDRATELCHRLGITRSVLILESAVVAVPTVAGWLRPVILLPAGVLVGMPAAHLDAILAHELAHIRRHDYVFNAAQALIETLLFYHPAVWWCSRQVRIEREHCCDDVAVHVCGDRLTYATALTNLEEHRPPRLAFALNATGGRLVDRVRRVLGGAEPSHERYGRGWAAAVSLILIVTLATIGTRDGGEAAVLPDPLMPGPDQREQPDAQDRSGIDAAEFAVRTLEQQVLGLADSGADVEQLAQRRAELEAAVERLQIEQDAFFERQRQRIGRQSDPATPASLAARNDRSQNPERLGPLLEPAPWAEWPLVRMIRALTPGTLPVPPPPPPPIPAAPPIPPMPPIPSAPPALAPLAQQVQPPAPAAPVTPPAPAAPVTPPIPAAPVTPPAPPSLPPLPPLPPEPPDDADFTVRWSDGFGQWSLAHRGTITLADDDTDVVGISSGGYLTFAESGVLATWFGAGRQVTLRGRTDGTVERTYRVNGRERPFEPEGREWLRQILPRTVRQTGLGAEARIERILSRRGVRGVIDEISRLPTDFVTGLYVRRLVAGVKLPPGDLADLLRTARRIQSDHELGRALTAIAEQQQLIGVAVEPYFETLSTVESDVSHAAVLRSLAARGLARSLSGQILTSAHSIQSDHELGMFLREAHDLAAANPAAFFAAAATIASDHEHRLLLSALASVPAVSMEMLEAVLRAAQHIDSDHEVANLLIEIGDRHRLEGRVREAYQRAVESIGSSFERDRVTNAMRARRSRTLPPVNDRVDGRHEENARLLASTSAEMARLERELSQKGRDLARQSERDAEKLGVELLTIERQIAESQLAQPRIDALRRELGELVHEITAGGTASELERTSLQLEAWRLELEMMRMRSR